MKAAITSRPRIFIILHIEVSVQCPHACKQKNREIKFILINVTGREAKGAAMNFEYLPNVWREVNAKECRVIALNAADSCRPSYSCDNQL